MKRPNSRVMALAREAIAAGKPLEVRTIRQLRAKNRQAATLYKAIFWVGIVLFNVALWVPLPIAFDRAVHVSVAVVSLLVAVVVPIIGLRKHQFDLELLKVNKDSLPRKTVNETGRVYMDKVKAADRPFINAEYQLLYGSKWPDGGSG